MTEAACTVTVYNNQMRPIGEVGDYTSVQVEFKRNAAGAGTIIVPYTNPTVFNRIQEHTFDTVPVMVDFEVGPEGARKWVRWPGLVMSTELAGDFDNPVVTATLAHYWEILEHVLAWPNPYGDPLVQAPAYDFQAGPVADVLAHYIRANMSSRLGMPVIVRNPAPGSPWINLAARMTPLSELIQQATKDVGWTVTTEMWLPEDDPIPEYTLTGPTLVFDVVPAEARPGVFFSNANPGEVTDPKVVAVAQTAYSVMGGGKSPKAVNDLLENLLGGFLGSLLANWFLAFNYYIDAAKKAAAGQFGLAEVFVAAGSQAFTTDILQAGIQGMFDAAGKVKATFGVPDNMPGRVFGVDYFVGDVITAELWGTTYAVPLASMTVKDDRSSGLTFTSSCGDDAATEVPLLKIVRRLKELGSNLQAISNA